MTIDLVDADRPHRLSWRIESAGMRVDGQQTITEAGGGSAVRWSWDFHARGAPCISAKIELVRFSIVQGDIDPAACSVAIIDTGLCAKLLRPLLM